MEINIDPEFAQLIPDPCEVRATDDKAINDGSSVVQRGWKPADEWRRTLADSIARDFAANKEHVVEVYVWKQHGTVVDGIERYLICQRLGIKPVINELDLADRKAALLKRWELNVTTSRAIRLSEFPRAEHVARLWDKYFRPVRTAAAKANKGGRGQKIPPEQKVNQTKEMALMAAVAPSTMALVRRLISYLDNSSARMPKNLRDEMLRKLRNSTKGISGADLDVTGYDQRASRSSRNRGSKAKPLSLSESEQLRTKWTDETNVVINKDSLSILANIPEGAIDRFVFSPPYYLCDASGYHIQYGELFQPFESWDQYCNWTARYLTQMWRIIPEGGYIVINVDNSREPEDIRTRDADGNVIDKKPNPLAGTFWYHTDLIRAVMRDIHFYAAIESELWDDESLNPMLPSYTDRFTRDMIDGSRLTHSSHPLEMRPDKLMERLETVGSVRMPGGGLRAFGKPPVDCGEYIWAKSQIVAKRSAVGSENDVKRRPNHEYVLFWRKGDEEKKASLMRDVDLTKGSISSWEDWEALDEFENGVFESYLSIPAAPDSHKEERPHPAPFPRKLAWRMIIQGAGVGDVICDPFCGRGTTLYVAARMGLEYVGIELDPGYAARSHREAQAGQRAYEAENLAR